MAQLAAPVISIDVAGLLIHIASLTVFVCQTYLIPDHLHIVPVYQVILSRHMICK